MRHFLRPIQRLGAKLVTDRFRPVPEEVTMWEGVLAIHFVSTREETCEILGGRPVGFRLMNLASDPAPFAAFWLR